MIIMIMMMILIIIVILEMIKVTYGVYLVEGKPSQKINLISYLKVTILIVTMMMMMIRIIY